MTNAIYYGDNLDILREYIKDGSVDLIYLDVYARECHIGKFTPADSINCQGE